MASIGAEVGQKMRSAIKAKLLELNCYVDDELPDYVMVMVANKRTKSQMKEDLQLFLTTKTGSFVDWLHIVLKKLKEVTVTNPEVYKKTVKRKSDETGDVNVKKEKKSKKADKKAKTEPEDSTVSLFKSLTDDLPISANKLSEQRKIIVMKENKMNSDEVDNFDIPPLSAVNLSTEEELEDIEKKIKSVKSRLGLMVESEDEADCINLKAEPDELFPKEKSPKPPSPKKIERARITFSRDEPKRKSVLDRLGKRRASEFKQDSSPGKKSRTEDKKNKIKESILNRLGVMSKVSVPVKHTQEPEEPFKNREVPSMVKIKPRVIPHDAPQANKNLLLKAVAEAQRSIAQAPPVGNSLKPDALYTKKYKEKFSEDKSNKKFPESEKIKIRKILKPEDDNKIKDSNKNTVVEYVPTPINKTVQTNCTNKPDEENGKLKQQKFIVTLDGIDKTKFKDLESEEDIDKAPIKSRLDRKKTPSPIIFDKVSSPVKTKSLIPDKLPIVHASPSVKNKERCKYWPSCRHGEKCEFVHPSTNCDKFPHCKFGEKCLYLHPSCKFGNSCTRRDCPYSHNPQNKLVSRLTNTSPVKPPALQICKYFPNCTNVNCGFYHPKPCKFGKYCKNPSECNFAHAYIANKSSLTWKK